MAGGMNRPGTGAPAWLRQHHLDATRPLPPAALATPPGALGPSRRHCWVRGDDGASEWSPAVMLRWRRAAEGWSAQVAYVVDGAAGTESADAAEPALVVAWVAAAHLRPA